MELKKHETEVNSEILKGSFNLSTEEGRKGLVEYHRKNKEEVSYKPFYPNEYSTLEIKPVAALNGQLGVFALEDIEKGCRLAFYNGKREQFEGQNFKNNDYRFNLDKGVSVNAEKTRNWPAYVNHSEFSNVVPMQCYEENKLQVVYKSIRNIKEGEQLLCHYGHQYFIDKNVTYAFLDASCDENYPDNVIKAHEKQYNALTIKNVFNLKSQDSTCMLATQLFIAVYNNDQKTVTKLLKHDDTVNLPSYSVNKTVAERYEVKPIDEQENYTPFMLACFLGNIKIIKLLLANQKIQTHKRGLHNGNDGLFYLLKGLGDSEVKSEISKILLDKSSDESSLACEYLEKIVTDLEKGENPLDYQLFMFYLFIDRMNKQVSLIADVITQDIKLAVKLSEILLSLDEKLFENSQQQNKVLLLEYSEIKRTCKQILRTNHALNQTVIDLEKVINRLEKESLSNLEETVKPFENYVASQDNFKKSEIKTPIRLQFSPNSAFVAVNQQPSREVHRPMPIRPTNPKNRGNSKEYFERFTENLDGSWTATFSNNKEAKKARKAIDGLYSRRKKNEENQFEGRATCFAREIAQNNNKLTIGNDQHEDLKKLLINIDAGKNPTVLGKRMHWPIHSSQNYGDTSTNGSQIPAISKRRKINQQSQESVNPSNPFSFFNNTNSAINSDLNVANQEQRLT